jgi:hypothetical protein
VISVSPYQKENPAKDHYSKCKQQIAVYRTESAYRCQNKNSTQAKQHHAGPADYGDQGNFFTSPMMRISPDNSALNFLIHDIASSLRPRRADLPQ